MQRGVCRIAASHRNLTLPGTSWQCRVQPTWIHLVPSCNKVGLFYPLFINEVIPAQHQHQAAGDSCLAPPSAHPRPVQLCRQALQQLSRSSPDPNCMIWKSLDTSSLQWALARVEANLFVFPFGQSAATPPTARKGSVLLRSTECFQEEQQLYNIPSSPEKTGAVNHRDSPVGNVSKVHWAWENSLLLLLGCWACMLNHSPSVLVGEGNGDKTTSSVQSFVLHIKGTNAAWLLDSQDAYHDEDYLFFLWQREKQI